jgi:hypothetical protein
MNNQVNGVIESTVREICLNKPQIDVLFIGVPKKNSIKTFTNKIIEKYYIDEPIVTKVLNLENPIIKDRYLVIKNVICFGIPSKLIFFTKDKPIQLNTINKTLEKPCLVCLYKNQQIIFMLVNCKNDEITRIIQDIDDHSDDKPFSFISLDSYDSLIENYIYSNPFVKEFLSVLIGRPPLFSNINNRCPDAFGRLFNSEEPNFGSVPLRFGHPNEHMTPPPFNPNEGLNPMIQQLLSRVNFLNNEINEMKIKLNNISPTI